AREKGRLAGRVMRGAEADEHERAQLGGAVGPVVDEVAVEVVDVDIGELDLRRGVVRVERAELPVPEELDLGVGRHEHAEGKPEVSAARDIQIVVDLSAYDTRLRRLDALAGSVASFKGDFDARAILRARDDRPCGRDRRHDDNPTDKHHAMLLHLTLPSFLFSVTVDWATLT